MNAIHDSTVGDLMSTSLRFISESASLAEAVQQMIAGNVSSLVVEKAHEHDSYGIITRKDIVVEAAEDWDGFTNLQVHDLASKPAVDIQSKVGVKHAVRLMRLVGVRRLLVMEGDKLVGIISNSDIFRGLA
jgi:predicted transcriptional regulator